MLIEGKNAVRQALLSENTINKIFIDKNYSSRKDEIISLASQNRVKIEYMPKVALDKMSKTNHHQGYIAEITDFKYSSVDEILELAKERNEKPFIVLLDGIVDPHNFGAIIRSCECAGVHGIIIPKDRSISVNETVIHTSTGAVSEMKIARVVNLKSAITYLQENDVWVFAAEAGGEDIYSKNLNIPLAVIIGSEGKGVKQSILNYTDGVIALPLKGKVNSLNASVACGIIIFEALRQRLK